MTYVYALILRQIDKVKGYGIILGHLANVKGESIRRTFNQKE
jgi:hypothetical protein